MTHTSLYSRVTFFLMIAILVLTLTACEQKPSGAIKVGLVVPLEHQAMNEITAGFSETLKQRFHRPIIIKVANAQGDPNLEHAIIQQMHDENVDLIAPIGTDASRMALALAHQQPIVSLAGDISEQDRKKSSACHVAAVHDEISSTQLIEFFHKAYPEITEIMLIHSAADKIFPEVEETIAAGKKRGIHIQHLMVTSLPELTNAANAIPANTQAILILKDSLIVSGITTLVHIAKTHHLHLLSSDQGSVENGADIALGVHEKEIGIEGGKLAAEILSGKNPCELPIIEMKTLTVFLNTNKLSQRDSVISAANEFHYTVEPTRTKG